EAGGPGVGEAAEVEAAGDAEARDELGVGERRGGRESEGEEGEAKGAHGRWGVGQRAEDSDQRAEGGDLGSFLHSPRWRRRQLISRRRSFQARTLAPRFPPTPVTRPWSFGPTPPPT